MSGLEEELKKQFAQTEKLVLELKKKYEHSRERVQVLKQENADLKTKLDAADIKVKKLEADGRESRLKLAASGDSEYNRLMKNHINRLIKEVDYCIAELKNNGL